MGLLLFLLEERLVRDFFPLPNACGISSKLLSMQGKFVLGSSCAAISLTLLTLANKGLGVDGSGGLRGLGESISGGLESLL
jgi:hypothetical protein